MLFRSPFPPGATGWPEAGENRIAIEEPRGIAVGGVETFDAVGEHQQAIDEGPVVLTQGQSPAQAGLQRLQLRAPFRWP